MKDTGPSAALRRALLTFARIGRWGTCGECPASDGLQIPELCQNTERYDHQLDWRALTEAIAGEFGAWGSQ